MCYCVYRRGGSIVRRETAFYKFVPNMLLDYVLLRETALCMFVLMMLLDCVTERESVWGGGETALCMFVL